VRNPALYERLEVQPELHGDAGAIADQPFVGDLVGDAIAIGDGADGEAPAGRGTVDAMAGMGARGDQPVRAQEALILVPRPDHVLTQELAVGELGQRGERAVDGGLVADRHAHGHRIGMSRP
jgi:hypothetical protein